MSDADSPARSPEPEQDDDDVRDDGHDSDLLSEIDEDQFEDYNPDTANIEDRPVNIDEDMARTLKASKRKGGAANVARKVKEGRREKKRQRGGDDDGDGDDADGAAGGDGDGGARRPRKARKAAAAAAAAGAGESQRRRASSSEAEPENEENLTPEERRRRALDRAMDAATKSKVKRRKKKDEIDLDDELDEQIAALKIEMERACEADNRAREAGQPALHKLKLLPSVVSLLNRTNAQEHVLDPDTNFLQHVKFFLEPLNDGSLPAYNIQRDVFSALTRLPVEKETLLSSGIGKVVLFYTRSRRPEVEIKRMAERLVRDWSRPILKRTDDFKKRHVETRDFDYQAAKMAQRQTASSQFALAQRPAQSQRDVDRERLLAPVVSGNRARIPTLPASYTVAPKSTFDPARGSDYRPIGASGMEAFRKMTQKGKKRG